MCPIKVDHIKREGVYEVIHKKYHRVYIQQILWLEHFDSKLTSQGLMQAAFKKKNKKKIGVT